MVPARPEVNILLCSARTNLSEDHFRQVAELLAKEVDWDYLIRMSRYNGVTPLLYKNLRFSFADQVPSSKMRELQATTRAMEGRGRLFTIELIQILELLESHGISAIPFKGPTLNQALYGNVSARSFGDLDIVVRPGDLAAATGLVLARGYRFQEPLNKRVERLYLRNLKHYPLVRDDLKIPLEIHWAFAERRFALNIDFDELWDRSRLMDIGGKAVRIFCPEDLIILLCIHGSLDAWAKLKWICDINQLIRTYPALDWERLSAQAGSLGSLRRMSLGLFLAHTLLGAELPTKVRAAFTASSTVQRLAKDVEERLFQDPWIELSPVEKRLFQLQFLEGVGRKATYLVCAAFAYNEEDITFWRFPPFLDFLCYPLRPVRLLMTYGFRLVRSLVSGNFGAKRGTS